MERIYPLRYSYRDYLPFIKEMVLESVREGDNIEGVRNNIVVTYSSYWIFEALEVLVAASKQKIYSEANSDSLLYIINLIL